MHTVLALAGVRFLAGALVRFSSQAKRRFRCAEFFVDANGSLADIFERQNKSGDPPVRINRDGRHHSGTDARFA